MFAWRRRDEPAIVPGLLEGTLRSQLDGVDDLPAGFGDLVDAVDEAVALYKHGDIDAQGLGLRLAELQVCDVQGQEWTLGATTRSWYRLEGVDPQGHKQWAAAGAPTAPMDGTIPRWQSRPVTVAAAPSRVEIVDTGASPATDPAGVDIEVVDTTSEPTADPFDLDALYGPIPAALWSQLQPSEAGAAAGDLDTLSQMLDGSGAPVWPSGMAPDALTVPAAEDPDRTSPPMRRVRSLDSAAEQDMPAPRSGDPLDDLGRLLGLED